MDSALWGALITGALGLLGAVIAKCRCYARSNEENECQYGCGFTEVQLAPQPEEVEKHKSQPGDLIFVKKKK